MKYKDWLGKWLANYVKPSVKRKTYLRYGEIVSDHIVPEIGEVETDELTALKLQQFVAGLLQCGNVRTGKGLAPSSVNGIITVLQESLKTAQRSEVANNYIADRIKRPKVTERRVTCFTKREQSVIENEILGSGDIKLYGILLCLYTGLRIGELLALTWRDIDLAKGTVSVNKSCHYAKNDAGVYGKITETPKTAASERIVLLPKQLVPFMREWKKKSVSDSVVANGEKDISLRGYQRIFERLLKRLGIERKGFHALRHTFATRALEVGMDVKTLAEILGHKNATVTLNRYAHSLSEHKRNMMDRVGKFVFALRGER